MRGSKELISCIMVIFVLILSNSDFFGVGGEFLLRFSALFCIAVVILCIAYEPGQFKSWVSPYRFFFYMIALTHCSVPFLQLFNVAPLYDGPMHILYDFIPVETRVNANYLVALFSIFMRWGVKYGLAKKQLASAVTSSQFDKKRLCFVLGCFFVLISFVPHLIMVSRINNLFSAVGYEAYFTERKVISTWFVNMAPFLMVGACYLYVSGEAFNLKQKLAIMCVVFYTFPYFIFGSRSLSLLRWSAVLFLVDRLNKKIKLVYLVTALFIVLFISPIIVAYRLDVYSSSKSFTMMLKDPLETLNQGLSNLGVYSPLLSSILENVPSKYGFVWGKSILNAALFCIPNLFLPRGTHFGVDFSVQDWLVKDFFYLILQKAPYFNVGYSCIGEVYQQFGWIGVPFIAFTLGIGLGIISKKAYSDNPIYLAGVASILPFVLFYARGTSWELARGVMWYGVMPYLLARFIENQLKRKAYLSDCKSLNVSVSRFRKTSKENYRI